MDALSGRRRLRARCAADGLGFSRQIAAAPPRFRRPPDAGCSHAAERQRRTIVNTLAAGTAAHRPAPAFLTYGFRPFFLAAGLWSALALSLWIVMFATGGTIPSRFDPLAWHIHEMLFGF